MLPDLLSSSPASVNSRQAEGGAPALDLHFFNTLSRETEKFVSINPGEVRLYACGPTVYHYAHIGNLRTYIFNDILRRTLSYGGYEVKHVMNITDVGHLASDADTGDDKMEIARKREGQSAWQVAQKYTEAFFKHSKRLNILPPTITCKATDHIGEQINLVKTLESRGFTYTTGDGVYFESIKFPSYGHMARLNLQGQRGGERVELGSKHNKTDFALWKLSKQPGVRDMEWESPWGVGFPGWHIECSAMAMKYLGAQIDIHTGGIDHIPVHHTNEIAQSEAATGVSPFVRYWMHGEFLILDHGKMSKSQGGFLTLESLEAEGVEPLSYRYFCLQSHYRSPLRFSMETIQGAQAGLNSLRRSVQLWVTRAAGEVAISESSQLTPTGQAYLDNFETHLAADLNIPAAHANLRKLLEPSSALSPSEVVFLVKEHDKVLGLDLLQPQSCPLQEDIVPEHVLALVEARQSARQMRDFVRADKLRAEARQHGYEIVDKKDGVEIKKL